MGRASAYQRATAARAIREGKSYAQAAQLAGVSKWTVVQWMKDPAFTGLIAGDAVITLGHADIRTREEDVVASPVDEGWVWIDTAANAVIGSLLSKDARHLRAAFVSGADHDAVRGSLAEHRVPVTEGLPSVVLAPSALAVLQDDPAALRRLIRLGTGTRQEAFRAFLDLWHFRAQESKQVRILGEGLWEAQEQFLSEMAAHEHLYALKARKLGQTTIACAYDGFVLRFRDCNARVHLFSRREKAARELLEAVRFGLQNLPAFLQLPARSTAHQLELDAGPHDRRLAVCYPTTADTAVEATSSHAHIDEWADMPRPDLVYSALEPTFSAPGCTSLIVTTGNGPASPAAVYWRRCLEGEGLHHPVFIPATARPDRDAAWLEQKRRTMLPDAFSTEYAQTWEQAIAGSGGHVFATGEIDGAVTDARPLSSQAQPRRRYVIAWDIGSRQDHSVGVVLDVTEELYHVAHYLRLRGDYPRIQRAVEDLHRAFGRDSFTVIEENSTGAAVADNVTIPEQQLRRFTTSRSAKERIIEQLRLQLQNQLIKFHPSLRQLESELRDYQLPDKHVVQDSVIALAIALDHAAEARAFQARGRISPSLFRRLNAPPRTGEPICTGAITWTPAN
jgi:phage terminase large subunit-like protein